MKITIYGAGYVGLVTAVCFAQNGHDVLCADVNITKINQLKKGISPIYEECLDQLLAQNIAANRLNFTDNLSDALTHATIQMIAVGTPSAEDGSADLQYVEAVARHLGQHMTDYLCVINKSTVPVGTALKVRNVILEQLKNRQLTTDFDVVSNPEFLREGQAIKDCLAPDRIVIGADSEKALSLMQQLYQPYTEQGYSLITMDTASAELSKYAANAFLATKISFMNEMSQIAEQVGANIHHIKAALGKDTRINAAFLNAGCGFGGSCFPKDVSALRHTAIENNIEPHMLNAVLETNEQQQKLLFHKINRYFNNQLQDKTIALWGLAFKPNTDDIRCASSRVLMEMLFAAGAKVRAYDPIAMKNIQAIYPSHEKLLLCDNIEDTLENADVLALVTEWEQFKQPDFLKLKTTLKHPVIFDGRNVFDAFSVKNMGFDYFGIGVNA